MGTTAAGLRPGVHHHAARGLDQRRMDDVSHDHCVVRRSRSSRSAPGGPERGSKCGSATSRPAGPAHSNSSRWPEVISALWVTSRSTIVTSRALCVRGHDPGAEGSPTDHIGQVIKTRSAAQTGASCAAGMAPSSVCRSTSAAAVTKAMTVGEWLAASHASAVCDGGKVADRHEGGARMSPLLSE